MVASVSRPAEQMSRYGRLWWLPASGRGNGLDDHAWAPALELSEQVVPVVLSALRDAGVPAYAARMHAARRQRRMREPGTWQLWVGTSAYGRAEEAVVVLMPGLSQQADAVWR